VSVVDPEAGTPGQIAVQTQYGATIAGVNAYVPHRRVNPSSTPSAVQVQQFMDAIASELSLAIGDLDRLSGDFLQNVIIQAMTVVQIGAAAWTEDASFPEQTDPQDRSSWGAVLWARYNKMKEALAVTVSRGPAIPDEGPLYPDIGVAWSKPLNPLIADVGGPAATEYSDTLGFPVLAMDQTQTGIGAPSNFDIPEDGPPGTYEEIG
jgi:hypothetical protein